VRAVADSDRLQELRRQRAAIAEHLAWLDREIRREAKLPSPTGGGSGTVPPISLTASPFGVPPPDTAPAPQPEPAPAPPAQPKAGARQPEKAPAPVPLEANTPAPALTADPDAVLEEWAEKSGPNEQPLSKTGCWAIFIGLAVIIIGGSVTAIYLAYS